MSSYAYIPAERTQKRGEECALLMQDAINKVNACWDALMDPSKYTAQAAREGTEVGHGHFRETVASPETEFSRAVAQVIARRNMVHGLQATGFIPREMLIYTNTDNPQVEMLIQHYATSDDNGKQWALNDLLKRLERHRNASDVSHAIDQLSITKHRDESEVEHGIDRLSLMKQLEDLHRRIVALE